MFAAAIARVFRKALPEILSPGHISPYASRAFQIAIDPSARNPSVL